MATDSFPETTILVVLQFDHALPLNDLVRLLEAVDTGLAKAELLQLEFIRSKLGDDLPELALDAATFRLQEKARGETLALTGVRSGSMEFVGAVSIGCAAGWVLANTLGETLKLAWLESQSHKKLKQFLLQDMRRKVSSIESLVKQVVAALALTKGKGESPKGKEQPHVSAKSESVIADDLSRSEIMFTIDLRAERHDGE